jgi:hypothetical protein
MPQQEERISPASLQENLLTDPVLRRRALRASSARFRDSRSCSSPAVYRDVASGTPSTSSTSIGEAIKEHLPDHLEARPQGGGPAQGA